MAIGPFKAGDVVRIPLAVTLDGKALPVANPRVQRLILPDQTDASGYPKAMTEAEPGVYYLEVQLFQIGNYLAVIRAELDGTTLEGIEPFNVQQPFGFPRIERYCDGS
jgi:hypothetical protein